MNAVVDLQIRALRKYPGFETSRENVDHIANGCEKKSLTICFCFFWDVLQTLMLKGLTCWKDEHCKVAISGPEDYTDINCSLPDTVVLIQFAFHYGNRLICGALNTKSDARQLTCESIVGQWAYMMA